jgi:hypothetical protein
MADGDPSQQWFDGWNLKFRGEAAGRNPRPWTTEPHNAIAMGNRSTPERSGHRVLQATSQHALASERQA